MSKAISRALVGAGMAFVLSQAGMAGQGDVPSKDDIIKALMSKETSTSRGFVQVPGGAPARPVATPAAINEPTRAPSVGHATPASAPGIAAPRQADAHASIGVPILFEKGSAVVSPESQTALGNIAAALNSSGLQSAHILLEGHTDGSGSAEVNQQLSEQRANAVKEFLIQNAGIGADRLSAVGKGQSEPIDPARPMAPENRRVVLVNLSN